MSEELTLKELIREENGRVYFPTICGCIVCGGIRAIYDRNAGEVTDKDLAVRVKLVQQGYYLKARENENWVREDDPHPCSCKCDHDWAYTNLRMCLTQWTCKKCDISLTVDSETAWRTLLRIHRTGT
jgi:hypothetical protein